MDGCFVGRREKVMLALTDIQHGYGHGSVLDGVSFTVRAGEVHALLGMNGAGKSTLIHLVAGVNRLQQGTISIDDKLITLRSPAEAAANGIILLTQEVDRGLVPTLTVHENLTIPLERRKWKPIFSKRSSRLLAEELLKRYALEIDVNGVVGKLSIYEKQMLSIIRAVAGKARYLFLDEPTASFDRREETRFHQLINELKGQGIGIVFVSHKMHEVFSLSDRISVLREGGVVLHECTHDTSLGEVVAAMTGGDRAIRRKELRKLLGEDQFAVNELTAVAGGHAVSFGLKRGEIAVVYGLLGSGKTKLARTLFGVRHPYRATLKGEMVSIGSTREAVRRGLAFVPEERRKQGIWRKSDIRTHLSLSFRGLISKSKETGYSHELIEAFQIRPAAPEYVVGALSGGNQQKVAIAKWFARTPLLAIFDEPMKGIDVAAKETIFQMIEGLAEQGTSVLYLTAEPDDALRIAERLYILSRGRIVERMNAEEATVERLMFSAEQGGHTDENS